MALRNLGLILALLVLSGCASITLAEDRDAVFAQAVEASLEDDHELAAAAANRYLQGSTVDDPRYDRAIRIIAEASEKMGFSYAASLWYLEIAEKRRDVDVLDDAVQGLERIMRDYPYDEATLVRGFVATGEITGLPPEQMAFLNYYQGVNSVRRGLDDWAKQQFDAIPEGSSYRERSQYVLAVEMLSEYRLNEAQELLHTLIGEDGENLETLPGDLQEDIQRTLARIAFEQKRYDDAIERYETIRKTAPDDPSLLLEMAWSHYYSGNYERALGLLIALDAPSYQGLIAPERFLLEALSLRHLCQFEPARNAAVRLRLRYGDAIDDLYRGVPLLDSKLLRDAARVREGGRAVGEFRLQVEKEARLVEERAGDFGEELSRTYAQIYSRGLEEATRRENEEISREMKIVAQELLNAEEGVRLILHELGVALLRGRRRPAGAQERIKIQQTFGPDKILYQFRGEFWTDELDDLVVTTEDRCID